MKKYEKIEILVFLENVSESLRKSPEGLWTVFGAWNATHKVYEKVHEECFAQHVDGAPSTAPSP